MAFIVLGLVYEYEGGASCRAAGNGRAFSAGADLNAIPHDLYRAVPSIGCLLISL